mmetsp:Transcript_77445/g.113460  ORF Transcript_77445/g.113460 Transcript_77445/m.113460 type:complete len:357 (+) Transcript_77445:49-1119(+)|eukprot:CAMPEP_0173056512 /NCGR_PEP_ID=MMETSP1102-20130122/179_1 /TAXON_ID=49646 /ORGANISM="Geminigera sp., Strain Caron Lab Isolate" /LENGTH=356 /DNA_ID=CAMNT_0013921831 /DNA_START=49 /DNA_END=1119 /DNA_ORIENTATION=-
MRHEFLSIALVAVCFYFLAWNKISSQRGVVTLSWTNETKTARMNENTTSDQRVTRPSLSGLHIAGNGCPILLKAALPTQKNFLLPCKSTHKSANSCMRYGTEYGGHEVPYPLCWLKPGDLYYGFGCGEDISFDISLADAYELNVRLFDPTPRSVLHVNAVLRALDTHEIPVLAPAQGNNKYYHEGLMQEISAGVDAKAWFEKIVLSNVKSSQIFFHPWALAIENGNMSFYEPQAGVSHSLVTQKQTKGQQISVVARELSSIMAELRDDKISVLKIDIEGYEVMLIPMLVRLFRSWEIRKWPRILLFDMDSLRPEHGNGNRLEGQKCVQMLCDAGYYLFSSRNFDYTFVLKTIVDTV